MQCLQSMSRLGRINTQSFVIVEQVLEIVASMVNSLCGPTEKHSKGLLLYDPIPHISFTQLHCI